jgi:hypothetical protein
MACLVPEAPPTATQMVVNRRMSDEGVEPEFSRLIESFWALEEPHPATSFDHNWAEEHLIGKATTEADAS